MRPRVFSDLADPQVKTLFTDFAYTAFRLNGRDECLLEEEASAYATFKTTGTISRRQLGFMHRWAESVVTPAIKAGKRIDRVSIWRTDGTYLDGKPGGRSDYTRFQNEAFKISSAAGENIRIITTGPGKWPEDICPPSMPLDFWLFDSHQLLELHFDKDNTFREAILHDVTTYPSAIVWANHTRDAAMAQSAPYYP